MASLRWICDLDVSRAAGIAAPWRGVVPTTRLADVLADDRVDGVVIATPAATHHELAAACLRAGKHVLVEKPLAPSLAEAEEMSRIADGEGRVLMCDHTYCYTPAVTFMRAAILSGDLGDIDYVDSVRINLGRVQPDVDVLWDLAPHDLAILDHVLPPGHEVVTVAARVADPIGSGRACIGHLTLELANGAICHVHVNWLSPTKVRTMMIGGSRRTLVWNDLEPTTRVAVYDRGVEFALADDRDRQEVAYRLGDMVAPALDEGEALRAVIDEFTDSIRTGREPATGAESGLSVLAVLEAATRSAGHGGVPVPVAWARPMTAVAGRSGR
jgi:predicted dehydrogenase